MNQLKIVRIYKCGNHISLNLKADLLGTLPVLTIDREFIPREKDDKGTPFKEISNIPPEEAMDLPNISGKRSNPLELKMLAEAIEDSVFESWNPHGFNLVFHSNGIDSRITSHFIRKAYAANPGPILFVCFAPEYENFVNIMKHEGWDSSQYVEYDIEKDSGIWDFATLHSNVNGCSNIPWNKTKCCLQHLRAAGRIPDAVTTWASVYCNETLGWKDDFQSFINHYYYSRYSRMTQGFHVPHVQPMLNWRTLNVIFNAAPGLNHTLTRTALLKYLDPGLAAIEKKEYSIEYSVPKPQFTQLVKDYRKSYYCKLIKPGTKPSPLIWNQEEWWGRVTLASLVEHLRTFGIEFR